MTGFNCFQLSFLVVTLLFSFYPANAIPRRCTLPPDGGFCRAHFEMYYYNARLNRCETFIYGGCPGNDNRFGTLQECQSTCGQRGGNDPVIFPTN